MGKTPFRLALVDDHQIVLDGLKSLLDGNTTFQVCVETTSPADLMILLEGRNIDILITDMMMPGMSGLELSCQVKKKYPDIKILALSMNGEGNLVNSMLDEADISGYILKNTGKAELLAALEKIASGGIYFSTEVLEEMERFADKKKVQEEIMLTQRELEIIKLIENENSNRQIAEKLFISERTVETHRKNIFRKTKTNSLIGLMKFAYEQGFISRN